MKNSTCIAIVVVLIISQQIVTSCANSKDKKQNSVEVSSHQKLLENSKESSDLLAKALNDGDFKSYNKIANAFLLAQEIDRLYYYSLIMANKHKCPEAYYHLFVMMNEKIKIDGVELYSSDNVTKNMSLYFLLKSKELGFDKAKYDINRILGNNSTPSSKEYLMKLDSVSK